ncbi:MAG: hypothetical protein V2A61_02460 [Calditrichota bacterium]
MHEVFLITWQKTRLELRKLPSVGVWSEDSGLIGAVELSRPTRLARFEHTESGGRLMEALTELLGDVDIVLPIWFLAPPEWIFKIRLPAFDIKDPLLLKNQIHWEIQERFYGESSHFRIIPWNQHSSADIVVIAVRDYIVNYVSTGANEIGLELAGIGLEPLAGESYDFEHPFDLREAAPLEEALEVPDRSKKAISPLVGVAAIAAVIAGVGGIYLFFGSSGEKIASPPPAATQRKIPSSLKSKPAQAVPDTLNTSSPLKNAQPSPEPDQTVKTPPEMAVTPIPVEAQTKPSVLSTASLKAAKSPLGALIIALPPQAQLELATISPVEITLEVSNLTGVESWLSKFKSTPGLQSGKMVGKYQRGKTEFIVVRFDHPGLDDGSRPRDVEGWQRKAQACGLKVQNRRAWGGFNQALQLADELWTDMNGFSKFYLAPEKDLWLVVIQ